MHQEPHYESLPATTGTHQEPSTFSESNAHASSVPPEQIAHPFDFLALSIASGTSYFAYWIVQLGLALFASRITRSPLLVSGIAFALTVPWLLCGLFAGALVDRYNRQHILLASTMLRLVIFGLATCVAILGYVSLPLLYVIALALGITQTLETPALSAAVPMVVCEAKLERANAWLSGTQNAVELLASPLGGVVASIGAALTLGIGAGCTLAGLVALHFLRGTRADFRSRFDGRCHIVNEVLDGIRFMWHQQTLGVIGLMAAVINACWGAYTGLLVLYVVAPGPGGLTASGYGILLMSIGIGGVIGTFLTLPVQRWLGRRWAIGLNIIGNALMFAVPALSTNSWIIGGAALLGGIGGPMWTIAVAALQGRIVPAALQGRVNAAYRFLGIGSAPLGLSWEVYAPSYLGCVSFSQRAPVSPSSCSSLSGG